MNCMNGPKRLARVLTPSTIVLLALLAILSCGDSTGEPVPSATPPSVLFATPPSAASTGADDESGSDITVELNQTATPYPTSTPYPTATPYPTPTPYPVAVGSGEQTSGPGPSVPEVTIVVPRAGPTIRIAIPKKSEVKHPKADTAINSLVERVESGEITAEEAAKEAPLHRGESVGVIILLSGNVDRVVAFLEANGASNINAGEDYIEAFVPVLLLGQASEQPGVLRVDQIQPPGETQGTPQVTGQGPGVHGSRAWNDAGYSGQGIKVGVIDRGFSGFSDIMGTEVPATVEARCYIWLGQHSQNLSDCSDGGTHGTIVSESVMDIAPEVTLYISDPQSLSELRDAVDWMISEGVSVINHSRLWRFDGPGDGTSPLSISPLNSIDRAVAAGIVWVNAAGNQATGTWFKRGPFDYTTETIDGEEVRFLRFSGSEIRNTNSYIGGRLELRWEDEWGGAETDLDLFALASGTDEIALQSINPQSGEPGHNPYESVGSLATFDILVAHRGGPDPDWIQLVGWGPTRLTLNSSGAGSIINPAESTNRGMLAVGAAPWSNTNVISSFSSRGPTPDERIKPDVVAANCGETATRNTPFCGTSQASPHVAGMAALVRQRFPNYTPAQVVSYIKNNAEQRISSPDPNNTWGHGFFVLSPVTQQPPPPAPSAPGAPTRVSTFPGNDSLNLSWNSPGQTGGAAITAYDMRHIRSDATNKGDANWTVVQDAWVGFGARGYKLADLDGGTQYDVQVRAVNSAGDGPWSATATGTPTSPILSGDATLSALTVIPVDIGFHLSVTTYHVGVANDVSQVGVSPVARNTGATVRVDGTVLSRGTSLAVFLDEGSNVITFTVTAGDGRTTKTYTVTIDRGSDDPFGWKVTDDFQLDLPSGFHPRGLWSNGAAFYTACATGNANIGASLCAFNLTDQWDTYHTLATHGNNSPMGIWSDGTTMWVTDANDRRIYAYKTASYFRDTGKEFGSLSARGIWSDGATLWTAQSGELRAYKLTTKARDSGKDFNNLRAAGNTNPVGIWSDGTTMWVADRSGAKLYAYDVASKLRAPAKDFDTLAAAGNRSPWGIWSDGVTMWVADSASNRIFSYNMPPQSALGPLVAPGAPGNLRVTRYGETTIELAWSPPLNNGGSDITGYGVTASTDGSFWQDIVCLSNTSANTNEISFDTDSIPNCPRLRTLLAEGQVFFRVHARNGVGNGPASNIATTTGTTLTNPCATEGAVPDAANNPGLVSDCETLLAAKVILAGTGSFGRNWSASTPITQWQGVLALGSPRRVTRVTLANLKLNGTIPEALGTLSALRELVLRDNDLTGDIPPVFGNLRNLTELKLDGNELSGVIPGELGNLADLGILWLSNNNLSGGIPPELGNLGNLRLMYLYNNNLSGDVPQELGKMASLTTLWISRNSLTGCVPGNLEAQLTGRYTDLGGLDYCASATSPGAPGGLTAIGSSQTQIDLSWRAPASDGGAEITGYRIEVSENRSFWTDLEATTGSDATTYTHTGLTAGVQRHYRISAINSAGTGQASGIATGNTAAAGVPASPTVTAATAGTESLTVGWRAPSSDGGSPITAYDLRHIRNDATNKSDANWTVVQDVWTGSGALSHELAGLDGGIQYDVQVRAVNSAGDGAWSATATGTPEATTPVPASPADTQFHRDGAATVVTWDPSTGATHYKVYHSDLRFARCTLLLSGTLSGCGELSGSVSGTTYTHTDPDADTNHYWVTACNSAGCSDIDSSNPARFMDNRPPAPANSQFRRDGSTTLVSWGPSTGATHYKVYYDDFFDSSCRLSRGSPSFCDELAGNVRGTSYTHTDPDEDKNYYWVTACNSTGCSDIDSANPAGFVETTPVVTVPGAPTSLTATADGETEIDLSWTAPSDNGGVSITGYRIETSNNGSSWSNLEANTNSASTTYTHTGLMAGDTRHYRVSAINSEGTGPVSNTDSAITDAASPSDTRPCATDGAVANPDNNEDLISDCETLLGLKNKLVGTGSLNWSPSTLINSWDGITVGGSPARVTRLELRVRGSTRVTGQLPAALGELAKLEVLAIYGASTNDGEPISLTGSIPAELGNLTKLSEFTLHQHEISGAIPAALGNLSDLEKLQLNFTQLGGSIPASLGNLSKLKTLSLYDNDLSGTLPAELGRLGNLLTLNFNLNRVSGPIPAQFGNLSSLMTLTLQFNQLSGSIPTELASLSTLQEIYVSQNNFTGCIPSALQEVAKNDLDRVGLPDCDGSTEPGKPTSLMATADGQTEIDLSWTAPSDDGGADITGYRIEVSNNGSNWSDLVADTNSTYTSYSHSGLSAGNTRHYRVSAINSEGTGPASGTDSATTDAATAPDLSVDMPTLDDSSLETGDSFTLSATVRNGGDASLASTTLRYYRSTDSTITSSDTSVGTDSVSGISAGGSGDESIDLTAPDTPGTYYYGACVDSVSGESDTTNNCSSGVAVTVSAAAAPDLTVDTPTVDDSTLETGDSFTLSATVRNQGDGASVATTLRYYRSTDSTITRSDTSVGTDSVSRLSAGGSGDESIDLTAPSTAGTYYYGACVDSVSGESDTTNNCSASVEVTVSSAPDPTPTGEAVTGSITSCQGEQVAPGIDSYRITIVGTVAANRAVKNVRVEGTFNGRFVGIEVVGDMDAGDAAGFSITGYVSESVGTCGADVEWLEIN